MEEEHIIEITPEQRYQALLHRLSNNNTWLGGILRIDHGDVLRLILQNVDRFSQALLGCKQRISSISIADHESVDANRPPIVEVTNENMHAFEKLCAAFARRVRIFTMCGSILGCKAMATIVKEMPRISDWIIYLSSSDAQGDAERDHMIALVEALSNHPCRRVELGLKAKLPIFNGSIDTYVLSRLLSLNRLNVLRLESLHLSLDECNTIATILSSNSFSARNLKIISCTFQDVESGKAFASAIQNAKRIKDLRTCNVIEENEPFAEAFAEALAQNKSIVGFFNYSSAVENRATANLISRVVRRNKTMEYLGHQKINRTLPTLDMETGLSEEECLEIRQALQENYTLEQVIIEKWSTSLDITRLNQAGRRYMLEDAASRSKCIAVLAKVKNHVDSLYFHLRENPVLFTGGNVDNTQLDDCKKRKADDLAEDEGNRIKANRTSRT